MIDKNLKEIEKYYASKFESFGASPQGVDWNGEHSQEIRFKQLCSFLPSSSFTINDFGCGYGALFSFLSKEYNNFMYYGHDLVKPMVDEAKRLYQTSDNALFEQSNIPQKVADYTLASGIFNVIQQHDQAQWREYILETLSIMDRYSRLGFSFNCLTSYSDENKKKDYLYYEEPCFLFDFCKKNFSKNVSLLHDYDLYEFTMLVRKSR